MPGFPEIVRLTAGLCGLAAFALDIQAALRFGPRLSGIFAEGRAP